VEYSPYEIIDIEERRQFDNLHFALAAIRTEADILDIVGRYGLLYPHNPSEMVHREPVSEWFTIHREMLTLLQLVLLIRKVAAGDDDALRELRRGMEFVSGPNEAKLSTPDLLDVAEIYVGARVSSRLSHTASAVVPESMYGGGRGLFRILEASPCVGHYAYWRLGILISSTSSAILHCANPHCGNLFEQRDPRQHYCSPACNSRMRQRRARGKRGSEPQAVER
jgi:hypothetical protein